ncbi:MAG: GNAT family N-acetyltransferase [Thermoguttaceae bacterium]|nr:GNAT family N-acetyltransferase [Thermoguttaceae bacterium]
MSFKLRELERVDLTTINAWRNDPGLIEWLGAPFRYINFEVDSNWYARYLSKRENQVRCAIVRSDAPLEILGLVSLVSVDHTNRSAELHIMIGDKRNRGRGLGTFAVRSILRHAFYNMNLRRVELTVLETNEAARRLYEKCGFVREGVKREAKYKNGKYVNMWQYGILKSEFAANE